MENEEKELEKNEANLDKEENSISKQENNFSGINNLFINYSHLSEKIRKEWMTPIINYNDKLTKLLGERIKPIAYMPTISIGKSIVETLNPIQEISKKLSETFKPIATELVASLPKMTSYFEELSEILEKARDNPDSLLNWIQYSKKLSEYIWTIPYDMSSEELKFLTKTVNSEEEFDKYMLKYFDKKKMESLFDNILSRLNRKHKVIGRQIKSAYLSRNYALVNVALLSVIDELCSQFLLDKGCIKRKDILLPIIEEIENTSDDIFEAIPVLVLNDNINVIYETIDFNKRIKVKTNKKVRRNPSQHGQSFSNRKIDTIMLLNTTYYLLIVMESYRQYLGKIIYVKNNKELSNANTKYSQELKRFYIKKKYIRRKK